MRDHTRFVNPTPESPETAALSLHIERGRTQFPDRPIFVSPYLIGSGGECALQLGGGLPKVHSRITHTGDAVTIECLAEQPALRVNEHAVRQARLAPGSLIEVGPFRFRLMAPVDPAPLEPLQEIPVELATFPLDEPEVIPGVDELAEEPQDLSVHGLVERLETALARLETLENRRRAGLAALLEKVIEVAADGTQDSPQRRSA